MEDNCSGAYFDYFTLPPEATSIVRYNQDHGAMLITAASASITYQFYNADNVLIDDYTVASDCTVPAAASDTMPISRRSSERTAAMQAWFDAAAGILHR